MTPKERARLRGLANGIDTVLQIGKDGIGNTLIHQADITLEARELIKGRVLDTCVEHTPRTAAETLAAATHSEVVQVIGSKFVLYRQKKQAPKKKPVPRPEPKEKTGNRNAQKHGKRSTVSLSPPFGGSVAARRQRGASTPTRSVAARRQRGASTPPVYRRERKTPPPGADVPPSPKGGGQGTSIEPQKPGNEDTNP